MSSEGGFILISNVTGPVVTNVTEDTAASGAKLKAGDVILTVQLEDVHSRADFVRGYRICAIGESVTR